MSQSPIQKALPKQRKPKHNSHTCVLSIVLRPDTSFDDRNTNWYCLSNSWKIHTLDTQNITH